MESQQPFIGIDVSAKRWDVAVLPAGIHFTIPYTDDGIAALVHRFQELAPRSTWLTCANSLKTWTGRSRILSGAPPCGTRRWRSSRACPALAPP